MTDTTSRRLINCGLFVLRVGLGIIMMMHYGKGDSFGVYSHALSLAIVFFSLMFSGGGEWSIGARIKAISGRWYQ